MEQQGLVERLEGDVAQLRGEMGDRDALVERLRSEIVSLENAKSHAVG